MKNLLFTAATALCLVTAGFAQAQTTTDQQNQQNQNTMQDQNTTTDQNRSTDVNAQTDVNATTDADGDGVADNNALPATAGGFPLMALGGLAAFMAWRWMSRRRHNQI